MDHPIADAERGWRHVFVRDLVLPARIGVYAREQNGSQRIRINLDLAVSDPGGVGADELRRVVDYGRVAEAVRGLVAARHVRLVETLAEQIAEICLEDERVHLARIRIEKLDVFADAASVGVEIARRRR